MNYRDQNPMSYSVRDAAATYDTGLRAYLLNVYNYMASALALTGISAYLGSHWAPLMNMIYDLNGIHPGLTGFGKLLIFAPLVFVMVISFGINRLSLPALQGTFWSYAAVMGLSLSSIFFLYTGQSIVRAFFITAIVFGATSVWGYTTKKDLTGMGHFMFMGLIGVIVASVVNLFMQSSALQFATSILTVIIFVGLTAYDTQKISAMYYQTANNVQMAGKGAIMGALALYLDFINLFMMMLRFFGDRR